MIGNTYTYMKDRDDKIIQNTYNLGLYETLLFSKQQCLSKRYTVFRRWLEEQIYEES